MLQYCLDFIKLDSCVDGILFSVCKRELFFSVLCGFAVSSCRSFASNWSFGVLVLRGSKLMQTTLISFQETTPTVLCVPSGEKPRAETYTNSSDCDFIWWHEPWWLMVEQQSSMLLHIQTDRQVILDSGRTNWPVSPTQVNQGSEGGEGRNEIERDGEGGRGRNR